MKDVETKGSHEPAATSLVVHRTFLMNQKAMAWFLGKSDPSGTSPRLPLNTRG